MKKNSAIKEKGQAEGADFGDSEKKRLERAEAQEEVHTGRISQMREEYTSRFDILQEANGESMKRRKVELEHKVEQEHLDFWRECINRSSVAVDGLSRDTDVARG